MITLRIQSPQSFVVSQECQKVAWQNGYRRALGEADGWARYSKFTEEEVDQIDLEAPDLIPNCVATILHQSRPELSRPVPANLPDQPFKADPKPGRNDACPCGSGRKYKQYCALN